jgi:uncharacterized membrane protein YtjA (UPF0391 family)
LPAFAGIVNSNSIFTLPVAASASNFNVPLTAVSGKVPVISASAWLTKATVAVSGIGMLLFVVSVVIFVVSLEAELLLSLLQAKKVIEVMTSANNVSLGINDIIFIQIDFGYKIYT